MEPPLNVNVSVLVVPLINVNPESADPDCIVIVRKLIVPVPESVPLRVIGPVTVGPLPIGKVQLLFMVFVPVVWLSLAVLKVTLLQLKVAAVVLSKVKIPLL